MYNPEKPYKEKILRLVKATYKNKYLKVNDKGQYLTFKKNFNKIEMQHTDGIGSKGKFHFKFNTPESAAVDSLAMNLNDLLMVGGIPYAIQNHLVLQEQNLEFIYKLIKKLSEECKKRSIVITGGETSIQKNLEGMDLSITVSAFINKEFVNKPKLGDVLIGFKSNGLHSNGLTFASKFFNEKNKIEFTKPTKIYLEEVEAIKKYAKVNSVMHMTGGAYTKFKDILHKSIDLEFLKPKKLVPQDIFKTIYENTKDSEFMYKAFNNGIGLIISTSLKDAEKIISKNKDCEIIGICKKGSGKIMLISHYDDKIVTY